MVLYVVEYLTSNMLNKELFVFNGAEYDALEREYEFVNDLTGESLVLQKDKLEHHKTRPLRQDELT
jgi:hypothetical protein